MKVVVVDNASADGTPEMIASEFPEVDLIASARNLGFAAATNLGARRGNAPYLLALNPDTAVTAGALDTVIGVLEPHPEVGGGRPSSRAAGRIPRPCGEALLPDAAERARALQRPRPAGRGLWTACRLSRARGRIRPGGRRQRRLHAHAALGVRGGRRLRRGLLDVHGGPRPLLPAGPGGLAELVRARGDRDARQGRHGQRGALAAPQLALPPRHVPASTATTTRPIAPRRSTRSYTSGSPRSWRPRSLRRLYAGASPACASGAGPCSTATVGSRAPRAMGRTRRAVPRAGR